MLTHAQLNPRNLLQNNCPPEKLNQVLVKQEAFHPFPTEPSEWKKILPDSIQRVLIKNGEEAIKGNFPVIPATVTLDFVRNGDRVRYENMTFGKRNRLWNLVLAESIEGKRRFIDAIVDGIWSIAEESFWGASAHLFLQKGGNGLPDTENPVVDLFAAETAATLAMTDYFVGAELDSISPLLRKRIYYEVNRRIFIPLQTASYDWMGNGNPNAKLNNWAPWIMSNYLTAALLLEKDKSKRIQYVAKAMQLTDQYINGIGEDGASEEGPHYWAFGVGCVFDVLDLLSAATAEKINIYHEKIIRNMGAYIYRTHISGNYYVDVADSHPEVYPEAIMVWRFGKAVGDSTMRSFGAWLAGNSGPNINPSFHRSRALFDMVNFTTIKQEPTPFHDINDCWLPDVQLMTARISNGIFVAAHGGNNGESHNHNDVGDFIIYLDGDPVIIDVGSGTYTSKTFSKDRYSIWFNASAWHNLPTINGEQQSAGASFAASNVSYKNEKGNAFLSMHIEKAFPAEAHLKQWKRTIATTNGTIVIDDEYELTKPVDSITQTFMTVCDVYLNQPGNVILTTSHGAQLMVRYDTRRWSIQKQIIPLVTEEDQGLKSTWRNRPITRILMTRKNPQVKGKFEFKFQRVFLNE